MSLSTHCKYGFAIFILMALTLAGCKKYPEDDHVTLRSPMNRLEGKWSLQEFLYENENLTSNYVRNGLGCEFEFFKSKDVSDNASLRVTCPCCYEEKYLSAPASNSLPELLCNFDWEQRKRTLRIYGPQTADSLVRDTGAFLVLPNADWVIRKLTTTELKLEVTYLGNTNSLVFSKAD